MLDENAVVRAVCDHLQRSGYVIEQCCTTKDRGVDIIALRNGRRLFVEAKGATSSFEGSNRFGKEYTLSQVYDRVAKGIYAGMCMLNDCPGDISLAFPDTPAFRRYLDPVSRLLKQLGIGMIWVGSDLRVDEIRP